jgi:arsenate reductase
LKSERIIKWKTAKIRLELVRQKEKIWIENFKNIKMTDEGYHQTLTTYPILIERPILVKGDKQ